MALICCIHCGHFHSGLRHACPECGLKPQERSSQTSADQAMANQGMADQGMAAAPSEQGGGGLGQSNEIVQIH
jgi:predicted  nucleic acid-binding Zn-ribbon protein